MTKIFCISGPSGAGKSSLIENTVKILDNAVSFYFDAYDSTLMFPENVMEKLSNGDIISPADVKNDLFMEDLKLLVSGHAVTDPWGRTLQPSDIIILEEPYGRLRQEMDMLIHKLIVIDLPMEISLARRILRNINKDFAAKTPEERLEQVNEYLTGFVNGTGWANAYLYNLLKETSDYTIDGLQSAEIMADQLKDYIVGNI
ncbi:Uridine kinase [Gracilibacillus ureilyticus]|uniref:Uridine kinase n=1 Tax=Gracilibacillus ureilyticus TaxID=531814 RepID=A0A1H9MIS3_9BACI|nr:hypothetical protein [Gracilibacillus ureilyticus]SER23606.1 Uridine kinase [Gracilibacillus ureilyticus]